jgi:hypothetical protein
LRVLYYYSSFFFFLSDKNRIRIINAIIQANGNQGITKNELLKLSVAVFLSSSLTSAEIKSSDGVWVNFVSNVIGPFHRGNASLSLNSNVTD